MTDTVVIFKLEGAWQGPLLSEAQRDALEAGTRYAEDADELERPAFCDSCSRYWEAGDRGGHNEGIPVDVQCPPCDAEFGPEVRT